MLLGNACEREKKPNQETKGGAVPGREEWAEPPTLRKGGQVGVACRQVITSFCSRRAKRTAIRNKSESFEGSKVTCFPSFHLRFLPSTPPSRRAARSSRRGQWGGAHPRQQFVFPGCSSDESRSPTKNLQMMRGLPFFVRTSKDVVKLFQKKKKNSCEIEFF